MSLLGVFKHRKKETAGLGGTLLVDIHNHLLPGVDDGASSMDHTIGMLRKFGELGYQKLIFTPHIMSGVYDNTAEIILRKLEEVRKVSAELGLKLRLEASAEYYFDETFFERIRAKDLLPFHGNHILFEFSFRNQPSQAEELVFQLKSAGYQPVLAHFERYLYYHPSVDVAQQLRDRGCLIQVNLNSFTGHYGPEVKNQAMRLLKADLIDLLGSDCHRIQHLELLENSLSDPVFHQLLKKQIKNHLFL
ncbi:CpsB/CapC family capsule biosynthesis tyrosine phosphatase [Fluviicola sp.]|jgi:tyrosine-protein phosphatase YwqE|uniref:tyrosine-protein phosphatase n=1 Tax=Fluviicola sp. TaxID=1917219 RepID=UPI0028244519|nr:CpsB/CapC family capsule biosynthesis tyrosine phosphatase [Fluviicola sp.]MDR0802059.1 histidinol phosphatase [Fluviicola sp.]